MKPINWIKDNEWSIPLILVLVGTIIILNCLGQWVHSHLMWWVKGTVITFIVAFISAIVCMSHSSTPCIDFPQTRISEEAERKLTMVNVVASTLFCLFLFTLMSIGIRALYHFLF